MHFVLTFYEQVPFLEQEEYFKCFWEEEITSTFQQLANRIPLCLQWTASHVVIENDGVSESGSPSLVSRLCSEDTPALHHFKNHITGFQCDLSLTLDLPSHHHTHTVLLKPVQLVSRTAVLLGCWCNTDSCPKGCWSWAQLIQCRRQTKQGAAISWKLHAAVGGWSSSTVWTGHSYVLISYLSF